MNLFENEPPKLTAEQKQEFAELKVKMFGASVAVPIFAEELKVTADGRRFLELFNIIEARTMFEHKIQRMMVMN